MSKRKILVFAGSARKDSVNKKLAAVAANEVREAGAEVTHIDMADYAAPIYDGDLEADSGLPETMSAFKALVESHDAMLIVTPEYNGCVPPLLVNALSWASRPEPGSGEPTCTAFAGKRVAIAAASPGGMGGVRVIPRLRDFMAELGVVAIPGFATLPGAFGAFDEAGALVNEKAHGMLKDLAQRLVAAVSM